MPAAIDKGPPWLVVATRHDGERYVVEEDRDYEAALAVRDLYAKSLEGVQCVSVELIGSPRKPVPRKTRKRQ